MFDFNIEKLSKGLEFLSIEKLSYTDKKTNQIKSYFKSQIDLLDSELELVSFNQNFNQMDLWDESNLVVIEGYIRMRNNQLSIYLIMLLNTFLKVMDLLNPIKSIVKTNV